MSAKEEKKPEQPPPEVDKPVAKSGGLPIKTIGIVGVVMLLEAAALFVLFKAMRPKATHAEVDPSQLVTVTGDKTIEIKVVDDKFQNLQTGKVWLWDLAIFIQTKERNRETVENKLKQRNAEVLEEISRIISRAQHTQLKEPDRQALNRQLSAMFEKIFGNDDKGEPLIERVMIPKARGFQIE
jgi:hypothetical protein